MKTRNNSTGTARGENPTQLVLEVTNKGAIKVYDCKTKSSSLMEDVSKISKMKFAFLAQTFFWEGYVDSEKAKYESTTYQEKSEMVSIWKGQKIGEKWEQSKVWEGVKSSEDFKMRCALWRMKNKMNVFCTDQTGRLIRLELSPSGRAAFFDFRDKLEKGKNEDFQILGFEMKDHGSAEIKPSLIPTFAFFEPTEDHKKANNLNEGLLVDFYAPKAAPAPAPAEAKTNAYAQGKATPPPTAKEVQQNFSAQHPEGQTLTEAINQNGAIPTTESNDDLPF